MRKEGDGRKNKEIGFKNNKEEGVGREEKEKRVSRKEREKKGEKKGEGGRTEGERER